MNNPFRKKHISIGDKCYILLPAICEPHYILTECEVIYLYEDACEVRANFNMIYYRPLTQVFKSKQDYLDIMCLEEIDIKEYKLIKKD